jgi:hypothetical protein
MAATQIRLKHMGEKLGAGEPEGRTSPAAPSSVRHRRYPARGQAIRRRSTSPARGPCPYRFPSGGLRDHRFGTHGRASHARSGRPLRRRKRPWSLARPPSSRSSDQGMARCGPFAPCIRREFGFIQTARTMLKVPGMNSLTRPARAASAILVAAAPWSPSRCVAGEPRR